MKLRFILIINLLIVANLLFSQDKNERFWKAAKANDTITIKSLLEQGVDVNVKTEYGATALTYAADKSNTEAAIFLLENGADPNAKDTFYESTPFLWSSNQGNLDIIKSMIQHGADISSPTAILWAAGSDQVETVKILLEAGSPGVEQVIYSAARNENKEMLKMVMETKKADKEILTTALLTALGTGNNEIIEVLENAGAEMPEIKESSVISGFLGTFQTKEGYKLKLIDQNGGLAAVVEGQTPYSLSYENDTIYCISEYPDIKLDFEIIEGIAVGFDFINGENVLKYIKIKEPEPAESKDDKTPVVEEEYLEVENPINWPSFRGNHASGIADGQHPPTIWDFENGINLKWKTFIPGLAHSCPIVWNDRVFLTTALSNDTAAEYRVGLYGDVKPSNDTSSHIWKIYCLEKRSGNIIWEKTAYEGIPRVKRHPKATQANSSPATNGKYVVALFGSEGLVCYDINGNEQWRIDLGILDAGWFFDDETQWGHSSSPVIYKDKVIVQCDRSKDSYIAAFDLKTGKEIWKSGRNEISSWGTPTIYHGESHDELITNASKFIRGYDPNNGELLWQLSPNSEVTVATPVVLDGIIYITAGYPPVRPVYAVKPGGKGDISIPDSLDSGEFILWRKLRGGTYMPSPVAYNGHLYTLANNGVLTCYDALTGEQKYRERIQDGGAFTASLLAADGKIYCTSEDNGIFVIKAGSEYELITNNKIGEICMATPAITDGMLLVRGQNHLFCISRSASKD